MTLMDKASKIAELYITAFEEHWANLLRTMSPDAYKFCLEERHLECHLAWLVAFGYFPEEHLPQKSITAIEEVYEDAVAFGYFD